MNGPKSLNMPSSGKPSKPTEKPHSFKERQRQRLEEEKARIDKKLKRISLANVLRSILSYDPNDDPNALYRQIRPILVKMGIANKVNRPKTEIMEDTNKKGDRLYKIILRREDTLTDNEITRMKRLEDNFEDLKWSQAGVEIYLWAPFKAPQTVPA